jgi:YegS/Rv2252/BmrU family lipid kinase
MLPLFPRPSHLTNAVLVRNPVSRHTADEQTLAEVIAFGREHGWQIECHTSQFPGDMTALARRVADGGADVVLAHGGDGTINEVINGIAGTRTALGVLPAGTANVWAKEMRISRNPLTALQSMIEGDRHTIDLGRANGRYFLLMAGVGLDGEVIEHVTPRAKQRFGALSYVVAGVPAAVRTKPWQVRMHIDGDTVESALYWMVVGNTRSYGGFREITHRAVADDGKLDVAMMQRGGVFHLLADGARLFLRRHDRSPNVRYTQVTSIAVETPGLPVQVDGEPAGETPMLFEIAPQALTVIVPAGTRTPLLTQRTTDDGQHTTE